MDSAHLALVAAAAVAGGIVNAIAGGGSLITFPVLVACGLPPVIANVTNTVAMCPGYLGATYAQRRDLVGQCCRARWILPAGALGGVAGAWLLLHTREATFAVVVPFLLLVAAGLLAAQEYLRGWINSRLHAHGREVWAALPVGAAAVYGGYFGAGMGVIVLAALAVVIDDSLTRLNAFKQSVSLVVNVAAAVVFLSSGLIDWSTTLVMVLAALAGGVIGGAISSRVPARWLRWSVVAIGVVVAAIYFTKL